MPDNRKVQSNGGVPNSSNTSVDNIQEAIRRLKIRSNDIEGDGEDGNSSPYPYRPSEPDCIYYLRTGMCGYGSMCRFNHPPYDAAQVQGGQNGGELPERVGQPDCGYFVKTGTCKYGPTCKYHHPRDRNGVGPVYYNMCGLPMRQQEKPCPYYMRTGLCKFGVACKFNHPQPASTGAVLPFPGPATYATYGSSGSSVFPSSGLPYVGTLPAGSLPRSAYLSDPRLQGPHTYWPVAFSPSQGIVPTQGWNTYLETMSPISSTSALAGSGTSGQTHLFSTSVSHLPNRPDQPECRHFMNTGSCKYGSDCKYHHPRDKFTQLASNFLGPLGLPLRPGQAVCSYYSAYGLCKYGPTCKFDHPLTGYSYGYNLAVPTLPVPNPSIYSYQRNPPTIGSSETSPSRSSKVADWIKKHDAASNKYRNPDIQTSEDSPEQIVSQPHSLPISSELPHDRSD